jgi:DNA-binding transcriptional ArsR family regulator
MFFISRYSPIGPPSPAGLPSGKVKRIDRQRGDLLLNIMPNQSPNLDLMFQALADPTRRAMIDRLSHGPASVSELARPFTISLPAVVQHLQALENSGLVSSRKVGRVRTVQIQPDALSLAEQWINDRRTMWSKRLDRLGELLAEDDGQDGA